MNKVSKIFVTLTVFVLVILYFLKFTGKVNYCGIFDNKLSQSIELYFQDDLPEDIGGVKEVSVAELISAGHITLSDVENIGANCSGNAYVTKGLNGSYYYYNDITCGTCSIDNEYTAWSDWEETLPNFGEKRAQVQTSVLYNYTDAEEKITDWTNWGEDIEKIKAPTMPTGAEIVNRETEEKIKYASRDKSYLWYTIDNKELYNNGAKSEKRPSKEYEKIGEPSKRTTATYDSRETLLSKEGLTGQNMPEFTVKEVSGYKIKTPKYIYSYVKRECPTYKCYKTETKTATASNYSYGTVQAAIDACKNNSNVIKKDTCSSTAAKTITSTEKYTTPEDIIGDCKKVAPSGTNCRYNEITPPVTKKECPSGTNGGFYIEFNGYVNSLVNKYKTCSLNGAHCDAPEECSGGTCSYQGNTSYKGNRDCKVSCNSYKGLKGDECDSLENALKAVDNCLDHWTNWGIGNHSCIYNGSSYSLGSKGSKRTEKINSITSCSITPKNNTCLDVIVTNGKYTYSYDAYAYTYKYDQKIYDESKNYISCPLGYPLGESTGKYEVSNETCANSKSTTYYLKADGSTTTNKSEAVALTEAEFNALKSKNSSLSNYKKGTEIVGYEYGSATEGKCPSGKTCATVTMYKAEIYSYQWYKTVEAKKTLCNGGKYTATSPASGCEQDPESVKYTEWTEWSDKEIKESATREVKSQKFIRYRNKYIMKDSFLLDEWLPLDEFEKEIGMTISELSENSNYKVQKKVLYKYRIQK